MSSFENTAPVQNQAGSQVINGNVVFNNDYGAPHKRSRSGYDDLNPERLLDDKILASLAFPQMSERRRNVDPAHYQTCQWIFDLAEYKNWKAALRGLLWIKGKPGSGKSTLMSYLYSKISEQHNGPDMKLEFFFNARGVPLQRSPLGMLRTLLSQIFHQDHSVRSLLRKLFQDKCGSFGSSGSSWEWQLSELKALFKDMVFASAQSRQITIFIDALDEAGEQNARDTAYYFHVINDGIENQNGLARICISCRHYPIPSTAHAIEIFVERYNREDIKAFVKDYLHLDDLSPNLMSHQQTWLDMLESLVGMAHGVFQWVILVVPMVARWMSDGDTIKEIRERLNEVPEELKDVYRHIIECVINRRHRANSLRLFQWVSQAIRPLSVAETRYAMANFDLKTSTLGVRHNETAEIIEVQGDMESRIKSWSGGLIEVVNSDFRTRGQIIQVIHQSVNDFLLDVGLTLLITLNNDKQISELAYSSLPKLPESIQISHGALYSICLEILSNEGSQRLLDSTHQEHRPKKKLVTMLKHPFLNYAASYCLTHSEKAEKHRGLDLESESRLLGRALFVLAFRSDKFDWVYEYPSRPCATVLQVAAAAGLDDLVCHRLSSNDDIHATDDVGRTALHFAAARNHLTVVKTLVNAGLNIKKGTDKGETPLLLAARQGHMEIFSWLMMQGASLNESNEESGCALYIAALNLRLSICKFCMDAGADVNAQGGYYGTALQAAAVKKFGHGEGIVRLLLNAGADVNAQGGYYGNALQAAAAKSFGYGEGVVRLLLNAGADVNAQGGYYGNALQAAAAKKFGRGEGVVRLLLNAGADVNAQGGYYGTALQAAAVKQYGCGGEVVHILLNAGADVNAQGGHYGNALQAAAVNEYGRGGEVVHILLNAGADVNAQGGYYGNALQAAAFGRGEEIIQLLLDAGANVNA